jgi:hypothetical protein
MAIKYTKLLQKYSMAIKYTKTAIKIPNGRAIHQKFPSQGLPKYTRIRIFGMKINYLATLRKIATLVSSSRVKSFGK